MPLNLPLLLDIEQLQQQLPNDQLLLVQVCSAEVYAKAHIPGARHVAPAELMSGNMPARGSVPGIEQLNALLQRIGFTGKQQIIAYDDEGGGWAGRFLWTLDYINYPHYSYLNGGLHAWHGAKYPLASGNLDASANTASDYRIASLDKTVRMTANDILSKLDNADFAVWDARSPAEYSGEQVLAQQAGHIPGAKNLEWTMLMDKHNNFRLLPLDQIQSMLDQLGLDRDKNIVTHCQSHHRSGLTYLVAKILQYPNITAYDGSWSDWGNNLALPVET